MQILKVAGSLCCWSLLVGFTAPTLHLHKLKHFLNFDVGPTHIASAIVPGAYFVRIHQNFGITNINILQMLTLDVSELTLGWQSCTAPSIGRSALCIPPAPPPEPRWRRSPSDAPSRFPSETVNKARPKDTQNQVVTENTSVLCFSPIQINETA